jgi:dolichol-phosphate mannosyltransferase
VAVGELRPSGFKILLEMLARQDLRVVEVPFVFGERLTGESKASLQQGKYFAQQLLHLRFGRGSRFAAIGALGAVLNLGLMYALTTGGLHYLLAAVFAAETSIVFNFVLQERWVFADLRGEDWRRRFVLSVGYDNVETLVRLPVLVFLVGLFHGHSVTAQALTLAASCLVRFVFKARVVYRIGRSNVSRELAESLPEAA